MKEESMLTSVYASLLVGIALYALAACLFREELLDHQLNAIRVRSRRIDRT
jgi:hypothetical protein